MLRTTLLIVALGLGTSLVHAQSGQVYWGKGMYPPTMPTNAAPQGYYPGVQPTQYPMGQYPMGPYPSAPYGYPAPMPAYNYARPVYAPTNPGYDNGYGVNYYQMQNPMGYSATPAPYSAVANSRAVGQQPMGWPAPAGAGAGAAPIAVDDVLPEDPGYTDIRRPLPPVPFHRKCDEKCFGSIDYLGMFFRPMRYAAPLVTTGSPTDAIPGALGQPGTTVLFGNNSSNLNLLSGMRFQIGMFLDPDNRYSVDLGGFFVFRGRDNFSLGSDENGNPVIARPISNIATNAEGAFLNSFPATVAGTINVDLRSEMAGFELNGRHHWYLEERLHADALFGFRYLRLSENLQITEHLRTIQPNFVTFRQTPIGLGSTLIDDDQFQTTNQFYGPQIGGRLSWEQKWLTFSAFGKLGLGITQQNTSIAGTTTAILPTGTQTAQGGILALPTNIGNHNRSVFGILPEFGVNLGIELTQCVRLNVGYSILMWNHVVRPGSQFDRNINPALASSTPPPLLLGGPQGPIYRFTDEFFWAQAFNIGLEFHY